MRCTVWLPRRFSSSSQKHTKTLAPQLQDAAQEGTSFYNMYILKRNYSNKLELFEQGTQYLILSTTSEASCVPSLAREPHQESKRRYHNIDSCKRRERSPIRASSHTDHPHCKSKARNTFVLLDLLDWHNGSHE